MDGRGRRIVQGPALPPVVTTPGASVHLMHSARDIRPFAPEECGRSGVDSRAGGGAIWVEVADACVNDGIIDASGTGGHNQGSSAAGLSLRGVHPRRRHRASGRVAAGTALRRAGGTRLATPLSPYRGEAARGAFPAGILASSRMHRPRPSPPIRLRTASLLPSPLFAAPTPVASSRAVPRHLGRCHSVRRGDHAPEEPRRTPRERSCRSPGGGPPEATQQRTRGEHR
jgi:hypothetical protein